MKIAVIGSGISGLVASYLLRKQHDVTLFEKNDYLGGHTATKELSGEHSGKAIDTGFIVFNDRTYPHFIAFLEKLGVSYQPTTMSYSVSHPAAQLEYNGESIGRLFAQKSNWFNPKFYRLLYDIYRFNHLAKKSYIEGELTEDLSLAAFLDEYDFNDYFRVNYLLSMGAAIWSSSINEMNNFPALFFVRFFINHGLLDITNRPQWFVIKGGSHQYVKAWQQQVKDELKFGCEVSRVNRVYQDDQLSHLLVHHKTGVEQFDKVIFACHSDEALQLLDADSSSNEKQILGAIPFQQNEVILHSDISRLPKHKKAWAAWNYMLDDAENPQPTLTYNMNILQGLDSEVTYCVSLNQSQHIDSSKVIGSYLYSHPVFNRQSFEAQQKRQLINGKEGCYFCGAYWYNGFHEDGVRSALDVVTMLGGRGLAVNNEASGAAQAGAPL